jgi:transcriptional antiterminator RfaH
VTWAVAYTQPQKEATAVYNLTAQGFQTWAPKKNGRYTIPRYVFVKLETKWRCINGTKGISYVLADGDIPKTVTDSQLEAFKAVLETMDQPEQQQVFTTGQPLRIKAGPFQGCIVQYLGEQGNKLSLLVDLLRGKVILTAAREQVAPV